MKQRRRGISSIYGFIMIFLLSMASIQTWSSAVGSISELESASQQSHQLEQAQSLEHLSLSLSDGNLTVTNDGQAPSTIDYLRLVYANTSRTVSMDDSLAVGLSTTVAVAGSVRSLEVVTSAGNTFVLSPQEADPDGPSYWGAETSPVSGEADAQVYQNPSNPSTVYIGSGSSVDAFTASGHLLWSFDAGQGFVTDVMPLSDGHVYVSTGYQYQTNTAELYELGPEGQLIASYSVRLDQQVDQDTPTQMPVSKGVDSTYALYDGWFYSSSGPISAIGSDFHPMAAADNSDFYFYQAYDEGIVANDTCQGAGDDVSLTSFTPGSVLVLPNWTQTLYLATCGSYTPQLVGATAGDGLLAGVFAGEAYSGGEETLYSGSNSFLFVIDADGAIEYSSGLPTSGYSPSMATDGTNVYLALPQSDEVQVFNLPTRTLSTYDVGFPASQLIYGQGHLFLISADGVRVYGSGMQLEKTISLAPFSLTSSSNGFPSEASIHNPSFILLNSTSYAALLENSTGYSNLVIGRYA